MDTLPTVQVSSGERGTISILFDVEEWEPGQLTRLVRHVHEDLGVFMDRPVSPRLLDAARCAILERFLAMFRSGILTQNRGGLWRIVGSDDLN